MSHSVKSIRQQFKAQGVFYTSPALAEMLKSYMPDDADCVYDPTCGDGALLAVFSDNVAKYGQELDPDQAEAARQRLKGEVHIATGDTLKSPAFTERKFKYIVANPPFSVKWEPELVLPSDSRFNTVPVLPPPSKADYAFLLHILYLLDDGGVAATLNFPGILYRGQREGKIRQWIVERNLIESVTLIEGGYFEDTAVATALIVFRKDKTGTDIRFADHESGNEYVASMDEVRANGFNLSPSSYIQEEDSRPEIDPVAKEVEAREQVLRHLTAQLRFSSAAIELHEMLGLPPLPPISQFLKSIDLIIAQYR